MANPDGEKLLDRVTTPQQLRQLSMDELAQLADELRERIIEVVSRRGGHLASNLGVAELTIALHYVFDFSRDHLLWDVGHQCYAHKILTGRGSQFDNLRQAGGLSGFPSPSESPYDPFATGHAGTAISTAAGLAWADKAANRDAKSVAVVGDASIVNGLSMEGVNNAAMLRRQFLIVLNDNSMAIDRTAGAMAQALDRIRMTHTYNQLKQSTEHLLRHLPMGQEISEALRNLASGLRTTLHGGQIFEALGITYFGPIDGHDIGELIRVLKRLAAFNQPAILHVHTEKGRGAQYAVEDPCRFHSPSAYSVDANGDAVFAKRTNATWTEVFSEALLEAADADERVVAITAAMPDGTGLTAFRDKYPSRYIDVGISESHAVAMAAGLARAGLRPVVAVYSTFMQRAIDQAFQELALQKLPVVLCLDRAGLVGSDGAVHHGFADIAYLRPLPGMTLMAPADAAEMRACLKRALSLEGPTAIRYPRDVVPAGLPGPCPPFEHARSRVLCEGDAATLLCYGATCEPAMAAAKELRRDDGLAVAVVNARFAKPLDEEEISRRIALGSPVVVCEDHAVVGGLGSAVLELAAAQGLSAANVRLLGIGDEFVAHASRAQQLSQVSLDAASIAATLRGLLGRKADPARKSVQGNT